MTPIRKITLAVTLALAMVAALALPASAADAHVVVFRGQAEVTPLNFPGLPPVTTAGQTGTWKFSADDLTLDPPQVEFCQDVLAGNCSISADGTLGPVVEGQPLTGAWCGMSSGRSEAGDGTNPDVVSAGSDSHTLTSIGWQVSAGSLLIIDGSTATGTVVGLVQASGSNLAADCAGDGAASFDVNGVTALLPV